MGRVIMVAPVSVGTLMRRFPLYGEEESYWSRGSTRTSWKNEVGTFAIVSKVLGVLWGSHGR